MLRAEDLGLKPIDHFLLKQGRRLSHRFLFKKRIKTSAELFASDEHRYGEHPQEELQHFAGNTGKTPIVFIHGGGWALGTMRSVAIGHGHFINEEFPIFNLDYPLSPENPFPSGLVSCLRGIKWIKDNFPETKEIHLCGDSAGGNLAMMCGLIISNPDVLAYYEKYLPGISADNFPRVKSMVSLYGVLDRLSFSGSWMGRHFVRMYASEAAYEKEIAEHLRFTPLDYDWETIPPIFLTAAQWDGLTKSSHIAHKHFKDQCERIDFKIYPKVMHGFYEEPKKQESLNMKKDIVAFFNSI